MWVGNTRLSVIAVLLGLCSASTASLAGPVEPTIPSVYPHYVDVKAYPDYTRRKFQVPSWETLGSRVQLVAGRGVTPPGPDAVIRPTLGYVRKTAADLHATNLTLKSQNRFVWNLGGYIPRTADEGGYAPWANLNSIIDDLGPNFMGFDIGEQDGRYLYLYRSIHELTNDPYREYLKLHQMNTRTCEDQAEHCSLLTVMWGWHVPIKDGLSVIQAAETQNKSGITAAQVSYAFLRGAARQYGTLTAGDVSLFRTWTQVDDSQNSISLRRKIVYTQYQYNCAILGFETPASDWTTSLQASVRTVIDALPRPGVMHAPVALMLDFFSGWMPGAQQLGQYVKWYEQPYDEGDYLTHLVLEELYPRYEDNGVLPDETAALVATPHGDMTDVILSDASPYALGQYGLVVAASNFARTAGPELQSKIEAYVNSGGQFVVTADTAAQLWPSWGIGAPVRIPAQSSVSWTGGGAVTEPRAFTLRSIDLTRLPAGSHIVARAAQRPAVVQVPLGAGVITLILSPYGLNANKRSVAGRRTPYSFDPASMNPLLASYFMLEHVRVLLGSLLDDQRLFDVGNRNLAYITNRIGPGDYVVGVYNPSLERQPFALSSFIGPITQSAELDIGNPSRTDARFWPSGWPAGANFTPAESEWESDETSLGAMDVRLFRVTVSEDAATRRVLSEPTPATQPSNVVVAQQTMADLKQSLLSWPTFFDNAGGVMVPGDAIEALDSAYLKDFDGPWLNRQKLRLVVDLRPQLASGTFTLDATDAAFADTEARIAKILAKMSLLVGASDLVVHLRSERDLSGLRVIAPLAAAHNIHVQAASTY